jgi:multiple antibiotic resistance protein
MPEAFSFSLVAFSAIFFVVDPFAVIPLYLSITQGDPPAKKRATALRASLAATLALLLFAFAGKLIFSAFSITLGAFQIAGGIILFMLALDMLRAERSRVRTSPEEVREGVDKEDVAIIPLGIPMLAGPGSIATVTVLMSDAARSPLLVAILVACVVVTGLLTFILLAAAPILERALRQTGLNILNRVMGLILAAVSVQFVVNGIRDVLPQIKSGG